VKRWGWELHPLHVEISLATPFFHKLANVLFNFPVSKTEKGKSYLGDHFFGIWVAGALELKLRRIEE